jgi:hypothetical protein
MGEDRVIAMGIDYIRNLPRPKDFKSLDDAQRYSEDLLGALERWQVETTDKDKTLEDLIVRPEWYGAKGDGVHNDTAAIQAAIDAAELINGKVLIGPKDYLLKGTGAQLLLIEAAIDFVGVNARGSRLLVDVSVGATTDVIRYHATTNVPEMRYFKLSNITIIPTSGTPARNGIVVDTTDYQIAYGTFEFINVEQLGGYAFKTTNPTLTDGFFTSSIQYSTLVGGISFNRGGDSITVYKCTLTGNGIGVSGTFVPGANDIAIIQCNITSDGPAIQLTSCYRPFIQGNNVEPPADGNYPGVPMINLIGASDNLVYEGYIEGNIFNASLIPNTDVIHLDWCYDTYIGPNIIYTAGTGIGIVTTANTQYTRIDKSGASWSYGLTKVNDVSTNSRMPVYADYEETTTGGIPYYSSSGLLKRYLTPVTNGITIGKDAGNANATGDENIFIGHLAGGGATGAGATNFGVGYGVFNHLTSGNYNQGLGGLYELTSGDANSTIGSGAGNDITTGDGNTCVGSSTSAGSANAQYRTAVGYGTVGVADNSVTIGRATDTIYCPGPAVDIAGVYKVSGTQVVGPRVVDARLADTPNSGDATTDGLIDALRDLILSHGLGASS